MDHIGDSPDPVQGIEGVQRLGAVRHAYGNAVALAHAQGDQRAGRAVDALHKPRIGSLFVHEFIGHKARMLPSRLPDDLVDGLAGIIQVLRRFTVEIQPGRLRGNTHNSIIISLFSKYSTPIIWYDA